MGPTFTLALQEIVRSAYRGLFQRLDVKKATKEDIYNYFVTEDGLGAEMAAKASRFFTTLCRMAQIELAADAAVASRSAVRKAGVDYSHHTKAESQAPSRNNTPPSVFPLTLTVTPEMSRMDVEQLTELFRKLRMALDRSSER
jgi:hypothetical protein